MQVLAVTDIHGAVDELEHILTREAGEYDLVLVAGDITDHSLDDYLERARTVLSVLDRQGTFVKAVPGNMDDERILKLLIETRVNLHRDLFSLGDYDFIGFGCSMKSDSSLHENAPSSPRGSTPFGTPFEPSDEERGTVLRTLLGRATAEHRVVVSHHPPLNTAIDRTADGEQVGSKALRQLIEQDSVDLVVSGHIHDGRGVDRLGETIMVNPGPVKDGNYAMITLEEDIDVTLKP